VTRRALAGRTVIVTRPRASADGLARALRGRGARVVFAPLIRTVPPRSRRALDAALRGLGRFDAVAFASANAVEHFFARADALGLRLRAPSVVAAVGRATAKAAAARGWRCSVVPDEASAAGLARVLRLPRGARVLLPRAERGRRELADGLSRAGARVALAVAYRTVPDRDGRRALRRALAAGADAACFASGSAVAALPRGAFRPAAVAIGPTTAAALRARGIVPAAVAARPDPASFAQAVARALRLR